MNAEHDPASTPRSDADPAGPSIKVGVSACLVGAEVRATGGHCRDPFLVGTLGRWVTWVAVCPEVEVGMPVPRPTIRLVGTAEEPRLVTSDGRVDHTEAMERYADARLEELAREGLDGYVWKKNSPTCGLLRVRVYAENGVPARTGRGLFARRLTARFPLLPVEEDGRLNDVHLRENFIERVFAHHRWRTFLGSGPRPADLVGFHAASKLALLSHSPTHYRALGRLVAEAGDRRRSFPELLEEYGRAWMEALAVRAGRGRHRNVLEHLAGFLKQRLDAADRRELGALIADYHQGLVPLIVPLTLLKHHLGRHDVPAWVHAQVYLNPYPRELLLRNHV